MNCIVSNVITVLSEDNWCEIIQYLSDDAQIVYNLSCVSLLCMLLFAIDVFLCTKNFISELLHIY